MSSPRVLIVNTDYPEFLDWFYAANPRLAGARYEEQLRARGDSLFGVADFYSRHFRSLGWTAADVHANNVIMQSAWAAEHGAAPAPTLDESLIGVARKARDFAARTPLRRLKPLVKPALAALGTADDSRWKILAAQIEEYRPDVVFNLAVGAISSHVFRRMPSVRLLVGQSASPLPSEDDLRGYGLLVSSLPNFVEHFRRLGVPAAFNRLAFEPSVLERLRPTAQPVNVSFVGSISRAHEGRTRVLEAVAARCELHTWGTFDPHVDAGSALRRHSHGAVWGGAMFQALADSRVTLNCHIDISGPYANNMRLFEATGVGTLLITDVKLNLGEMFDVGREVITYSSPEECAEQVDHFLSHDDERRQIAERGQVRTLSEHTYAARTRELAAVIEQRL